MTHVLILTTSYPYKEAGSEAAGAFVADFANTLAKHVQVSVLAPGDKTTVSTTSTVSTYRFAAPEYPLSLLKPLNPLHWLAILKILFNGMKTTNAIIQHNDIDHIFALWALPSGFWAHRMLKKYNIPYSTWSLGSDIWSLGKIPLIRNFLRTILRDSQQCFADGQLLKMDVERISGRSCEFLPSIRRLEMHETKALKTRPPYRIAYLGRWHPNKGIDLLLDSLLLLDSDDWCKIEEFRICGGGPLEEYVHTQHQKLLSNNQPVTIGGYLSKDQAVKLLQWADYIVIPSRIESIPVIFSDALQTNCPMLATPVGDLPFLLSRYEIGCLADDVTALSIANGLVKLLSSSPADFASGIVQASGLFSCEKSTMEFLKLTGIN